MTDLPSTTPSSGSNRRRNITIAVVAAALLLCCGCFAAVLLYLGWNCGDVFFGIEAPECPIPLSGLWFWAQWL
ncbi:MAG TPA: hypothetical protein VI793_01195 [Anaerolineales bacterium]|nr:hypothetical protein [Anaerolineales bacterium]